MVYSPYLHQRRSIRISGFDYSSAGAYFVTLCANGREMLFGNVVDGAMQPNELGLIVSECWRWLEDHFSGVELDAWVVMPNHLHGVLLFTGESPRPKSLGGIIGAFKTVSTRRGRALLEMPERGLWQRNYWEQVIRNERDLERIRAYIEGNPGSWASDSLNVEAKK